MKVENQQKEKNIYEKRFEVLMKLIRIDMMLRKAKITYPKIK